MAVEFLESQYNLKPRKRTKFLYTKGFQYSLDGENYIGEYHLQGDKAYTGPEKTATSRLLRKYYSDALVYAYDRCRGFPKRDRIEPNQIVWLPLETNYKTGYAIRYFVERAGKYEGYPIEIDDEQKSKYGKDGGIS